MQSGILSGGVMPTRQLRKVLDGDSGVWDMPAGRVGTKRVRAHGGALLARAAVLLHSGGSCLEHVNMNGWESADMRGVHWDLKFASGP